MIRACPPTNGDFTPSVVRIANSIRISSCAFTCTVHPHMGLHVLYILMCVYMYCTSSYAFTCTVHSYVRLHVLYILICVYMYCTSSCAFTCTVPPHMRLHELLYILICVYMYCTSTCTFTCTSSYAFNHWSNRKCKCKYIFSSTSKK